MKHYVLNLRRKPFRLGLWLGWNSDKGLPASDVTVCYALDRRGYKNLMEVGQHACSMGLDWVLEPWFEDAKPGISPVSVGKDLILHVIKDSDPGWYAIWEDDYVLDIEYSEFLQFLWDVASDPNVQVIAFDKVRWVSDGEDTAEFNKMARRRWLDRDSNTHPFLPLYQGCVGYCFESVMVVTPQGAARLLELRKRGDYWSSYEWLVFTKIPQDTANFWTAIPEFVKGIGWITGSDSGHGGGSIPWGVWDLNYVEPG